MKLLRFALLLLLPLAACTEENPTEIGAPLVPGNTLETFEVFLDAAQYLVFDTAFSGYADAFDSDLMVVARAFEGVTDANTLIRYTLRPTSIQVRDSAGTVRTDTLARFASGQLILVVDTSTDRGTARVNVHRAAESWSADATWTIRDDSSGTQLRWRTPGGTRAELVGTATFNGTRDSLFIPLDSAQIAKLTTAADSSRGVIISLDQQSADGARLRINSTVVRIEARSSIRRDTTVILNIGTTLSTFIFTPDPPSTSALPRVSGVPAWRTILSFRDDFRELSVPCPGTNCSVKLKDVHLNRAELMLLPTASPPGFSPEDSIVVQARPVVEGVNVPIARAPISEPVGSVERAITSTLFTASNTTETPVSVSTSINALMTDTTAVGSVNRAPRRLALLSAPEAATFGFATFRASPRLRLVLTRLTEGVR